MIDRNVVLEIEKQLVKEGCGDVLVWVVTNEEMEILSKKEKNIGMYFHKRKLIVLLKDSCPLAIAHEIGHAVDFKNDKRFDDLGKCEDSANRYALDNLRFREKLTRMMYSKVKR
jgi:hypothetical protein